jgi:hypothetical protein
MCVCSESVIYKACKIRSLLIVNEDFGGERNTVSGTLWTGINW